jgi:hypothetical protein
VFGSVDVVVVVQPVAILEDVFDSVLEDVQTEAALDQVQTEPVLEDVQTEGALDQVQTEVILEDVVQPEITPSGG